MRFFKPLTSASILVLLPFSQATLANCDANSCTYNNISIDKAGFYVASVKLADGAKEGMWGFSVNTSSGLNQGGFNAGATLTADGVTPGFMGFYLGATEAVSIKAFEYNGTVNTLNVSLEKSSGMAREPLNQYQGGRAKTTSDPMVAETTAPLSPGFYIVSAYSQSGEPAGAFGISVNGNYLTGGVNIGGWIDSTTVGFGAFYVASPQTVNFKLLFGNNYDVVGSGPLTVDIAFQTSDGQREPYWSSTGGKTTTPDDNSTPDDNTTPDNNTTPTSGEPTEFQGTLAAHNKWRQEVGVSDLTWSADAAKVAQGWADNLKDRGCVMEHNPNRGPYGENIFWSSGYSPTATEVVDEWASEIADYDYATNSCSAVCGHYTQVVWRDTGQVGCGKASCGSTQIWVCNYSPPGNYMGQKPY